MSRYYKAGSLLRRTIVRVLVFLCCFVVLASCSRKKQEAQDEPLPTVTSAPADAIAPDFRLQDLTGREVNLSDYRGKVVLLEFWATWCPPCRATIPELIAIQKKFRDRKFAVLGVSIDDEDDNLRKELKNFSRQRHINYTVLIGNDAVERKYKIWSIPRSFLIDKEGRIRDSFSGYADQYEREISSEVEKLL